MADENRVRVPKPSPASFNRQRLVKENTLLRNQVKHFHELEATILRQLKEGMQFEDIRTEGDAAAYIKKVTAVLHPHLAQRKRSATPDANRRQRG